MKFLILGLFMLGLFLGLSAGPKDDHVYQVISSHPHDVEELKNHTETIHQKGRLWIVRLKENAPKELLEHLRPLRGGEDHYSFVGRLITNKVFKSKPVDYRGLINQLSLENIKNEVYWLSNFETRYAGSDENQLATNGVAKKLESLGYTVKKICYHPEACSLVAEKTGTILNREVIMVMGHIDSVGEYFAGADDNASGVSVILEMARVLKDYNNNKTIRFFISNGEELGLIGSTQYATQLERAKQLKNISLVINMDMVGYNTTGVVELETDPEFEEHAQWMAGVAAKYTKLKTKISLGAYGSDHVPFLQRGVPTVQTIEDWENKNPCYHMECDRPDALNYEYATEVARLNLAAVLLKDNE
ncbi:M28 family metallopeptidase [Peredibacter starrii]|uniref:M28 family metallopeptidase n=1 Tax=Peredibacter starrii TaxID=28202 RepID=A0AAX4HJ37_9BACT|nr:M28 family metallopeptidase [Peredibacter starrii]WPU63236.1 M28 family metallopeptidase [Peredibacter starrii]